MQRDGIDPNALRELIETVQARRAFAPEMLRRGCAEALHDLVFSG